MALVSELKTLVQKEVSEKRALTSEVERLTVLLASEKERIADLNGKLTQLRVLSSSMSSDSAISMGSASASDVNVSTSSTTFEEQHIEGSQGRGVRVTTVTRDVTRSLNMTSTVSASSLTMSSQRSASRLSLSRGSSSSNLSAREGLMLEGANGEGEGDEGDRERLLEID